MVQCLHSFPVFFPSFLQSYFEKVSKGHPPPIPFRLPSAFIWKHLFSSPYHFKVKFLNSYRQTKSSFTYCLSIFSKDLAFSAAFLPFPPLPLSSLSSFFAGTLMFGEKTLLKRVQREQGSSHENWRQVGFYGLLRTQLCR